MIRYTQGNLLAAEADALVNTVNTVGVSGKGIALMFKEAFPDNFRAYESIAREGKLEPGGIFVTERHDMLGPRFIVNFATKKHWRQPSRLEWIEKGLFVLRHFIVDKGVSSIAIPPLGAGNGGLNWADVKPLIATLLTNIDCEIIVYEPAKSYQNIVKRNGLEKLTPARGMIAEIIRRYEVLGFDCSMLEAQKLAWFLSRAIARFDFPDPIKAEFSANRYGPYSDRIRHLLDNLDGSYLTCEHRVSDARPFDPIRFRYDRQDKVSAYLTSPEAKPYRNALDFANKIIDGFQSPHGLELLATVDWLNIKADVDLDVENMKAAIALWPGPPGSAERKARIFTTSHIEVAVRRLRKVRDSSGIQLEASKS